MVNWSDPAQIAKDARSLSCLANCSQLINDPEVFEKIIFVFFGIQLLELFMTCDFEWSLLTRRRRFHWWLVPFFFLSRYCMLFSFIGWIILFTNRHPINCGALSTFIFWAGNMVILCASTSLMLRTIAIWEWKRSVVIPLILLALAHWVLLYRTIFVLEAVWDHDSGRCVIASTNRFLLNITFCSTMGFDFVIFVTAAVALLRAGHFSRTDLWKLLFTDGLNYSAVTFSMNFLAATLNLLNLNAPMNVIAAVSFYFTKLRLAEDGSHRV
ncbi:hypothetical protein B0H14DRAFT_2490486 [Mycena olivaceomarginata]|nr:hypothetical protein B0H14DRAFT_2490486 [Mycena olivaceomarginata]